jgi:hypothetical protein
MKSGADEKVANDIRDYGWHCLHVAPREGEEGASFSYTIGLVPFLLAFRTMQSASLWASKLS